MQQWKNKKKTRKKRMTLVLKKIKNIIEKGNKKIQRGKRKWEENREL